MTIVLVGSALVFLRYRTRTATFYEDAGGWVYQCSKAIPVKYQGVTYMSGKPSLTPINQSDADKYCHNIGVE